MDENEKLENLFYREYKSMIEKGISGIMKDNPYVSIVNHG